MTQQVKNYNQLIDGVQRDISDQITTLTKRVNNLLELENDLYDQFFDQVVTATTDNFATFSEYQVSENAKKALAKKLQRSLGKTDNFSNSPYLEKLAQQISCISLDVVDYKLDSLVESGMIDSDSQQKIESQLQVINQYVTGFGLGSGAVMLNDAPRLEASNQAMTRKIKLTVPAGSTYQSSTFPANVRITPCINIRCYSDCR